ncbi:MAG: transcriptional repressor [Gemmataceae bacterium]|nr:transcriptional repressor [Gemmataceae bacterium]MCS7271698.1 transcriptional repressor [Gemmataceae bacterium]MDW8244582.1 Fur family transcriptional regulator [Thermogemmata sp.]
MNAASVVHNGSTPSRKEEEVSLPAIPVAQSPESKFREYLASRPKPQRFTEQQRQLLEHIFSKHRHFDAEQLIDELKRAGRQVSRATVYRTLPKLVDAGLLRKIELGNRTVYDHDYGYPFHDHFLCEECGVMIEFQSASLDSAIREVVHQHQFRVRSRTLVIRGICASCNAAKAAKRRLVM